jgi:paraquat-inducible protein A
MSVRNIIALVLVVISFGLLIPGLSKDLITISASFSVMGRSIPLLEDTRSILTTVQTLYESGDYFVAGLILLFSVLVPFIKGVMLAVVLLLKNATQRFQLFRFVRSISKWSMADVFVVGVYVAFLASKATENMDAQVHSGFYYFTAYCLVSLLALQFMHVADPAAEARSDSAIAA